MHVCAKLMLAGGAVCAAAVAWGCEATDFTVGARVTGPDWSLGSPCWIQRLPAPGLEPAGLTWDLPSVGVAEPRSAPADEERLDDESPAGEETGTDLRRGSALHQAQGLVAGASAFGIAGVDVYRQEPAPIAAQGEQTAVYGWVAKITGLKRPRADDPAQQAAAVRVPGGTLAQLAALCGLALLLLRRQWVH